MSEILISDSATSMVDKVNSVVGDVINVDDTATAAVAALNATLGTELSVNDTATDFVEALNDGLDSYGGISKKVRMLHFSDPHGSNTASSVCRTMLGNDSGIDFVFLTGDVSRYTYDDLTANLKSDMDAMKGNMLLLSGNHDTYDMLKSQQAVTAWLKSYLDGIVTFDDNNGVGGYWYKDIELTEDENSPVLRIISLDQYEIGSDRTNMYFTKYTQTQIDWLIARLKGLSSADYVIIAMHEPPVQSRTSPDTYAQGIANINGNQQKLFVSNGLSTYGNRRSEPNFNLIPRIVRAWMHKESVSINYNNKGHSGSGYDIVVSETFTDSPATFLFYIGGHQHADIGYYLPDETGASDGGDWSDQLMLFVTAADRSVEYAADDDLGGANSSLPTPSSPSSETYRINDIEVDFGAKTIKVTRHGDKNTSSGRVRDEITFPFKKS